MISVEGQSACDCLEGYTGFYCEFHKSQLTTDNLSNCSATCENGGSCQIGYRDNTDAEMVINPDFDPNDQARFEHCRCADGFTGDKCELKYTSCGDASALYCMFGKCELVELDGDGKTDVVCVCQNDNDQTYAGTACDVPATSFCTSSPGVNGRQFCANGGQCNLIGDG